MAINKQKILKNAAKYTKKNQYDKAISEYQKLSQEDYGDTSLNNVLGDLLVQAKRLKEAVVEYEKAGQFYEEKGFIPKALAIYKKILRYDPTVPRIYEKLAQLYSDQGLIQDAITQYEFLAKHYEHEGKTEAALDAYRQIADLDPSNLMIRERLASLYSQQGFKEKACAERVKIGERHIKRGDNISAIKYFEMAIQEVPDNEAALRGVVSVHLAEKRIDDAIEMLNKILEQKPDNISALSTLGRVYMDSGHLDEAIKVFNQVFELDPSQEGINEILGRIYLLKGNYPEAFKRLKEIINVSIERSEFDRALSILNQLQDIEPKNIAIREKKIEIFQKLNRDDDQKTTFRELAEIYYEKGRLEEAYNIYERLYSMDPNNNSIKQRFNQISIELRGRPIEIGKLVEKPAFENVMEEAPVEVPEQSGFEDIGSEPFSLEDGGNSLESLFDTTEIEKITIPIFGESDDKQVEDSAMAEEVFAEDIFSVEGDQEEDLTEVAVGAVTIEPTEDQLREFRIEAGVFMKYGLFEKAADRLNSILIIKPDDDETLERLAEVYEKLGQPEQMAEVTVKRAERASRSGDLTQARKLLQQAADLMPESELILEKLNQLGVPAEAGKTDMPLASIPAGSDFEPLVDLESQGYESDFAAVQETAGTVSEGSKGEQDISGDVGTALSNGLADVVREFREELITRSDSRDAETHYNLGIAYREMGLTDEAIEEFKLILDFPDYKIKGCDMLAQCFMDKGEFDKATPLLEKALKDDQINENEKLNLLYILAIASKMQGKPEYAVQHFEAIQKIKKNYRDVSKQLKDLKS
ncbi:tetratricopeptide repeat protein [bacterium]|nr:tetratricopeptide repeat protein [candidate division CSSED10-310 bacterium]